MTHDHDAALEAELSRLRKEYENLRDMKLRTEQDVKNLTAQLEELKARTRAEYGTDDPAQLRGLLEGKRAENARAVEEYRAHLDGVRRELERAEAGISPAGREEA